MKDTRVPPDTCTLSCSNEIGAILFPFFLHPGSLLHRGLIIADSDGKKTLAKSHSESYFYNQWKVSSKGTVLGTLTQPER